MMHFVVEPDIRNGISIMKYTINHPSKFKTYGRKEKINLQYVFISFILGMC